MCEETIDSLHFEPIFSWLSLIAIALSAGHETWIQFRHLASDDAADMLWFGRTYQRINLRLTRKATQTNMYIMKYKYYISLFSPT